MRYGRVGEYQIGKSPETLLLQDVHSLQLFQNVIGNAIKYGGETPPVVYVRAEMKGEMWRVCIHDNGIGIDPQYADQIFGIFKRLHTAQRYSGTGIGLAICEKIVHRYGGRIWVESEGEGKGSTFSFILPAEDTSGDVKRSPISVLIAEDNPADVILVRMAFDHPALGAEFTVQSDGQEMLHYIERINTGEVPCPDVILLDLNLPKVGGHAILAGLRESPVCGQIPVVIVSSSAAPKDREEATRLGATHYFCKPNDYDHFMQLGELIKSVIAASRLS